jgi:hypothetical protein
MVTNNHVAVERRGLLKRISGTAIGSAYLTSRSVLAEGTDKRKRRRLGEVFKNDEERRKKERGKIKQNEGPKTKTKYYTIPRSQWIRVETAQDACQKLSDEMLELEPSGLVAVGVVSEYDHKRSEKRLNIEYTKVERKMPGGENVLVAEPDIEYSRVEKEAPDIVTGVVEDERGREEVDLEVYVKRRTVTEQSCGVKSSGLYYDHYYDQCPGGAYVSTDENYYGTSCAPGSHSEGSVITTAAHISGTNVGDKVYQPGGELLGEVIERSYHSPYPSDGVAILIDGSRWFDYSLASDDGDNTYKRNLDGIMAWSAIKDMEDNSLQNMERQGAKTGHCAGMVTETYKPGSFRYFTTGAIEGGGDSGGPHFYIESDGDTLISGLHKGESGGDSLAPYIRDQYSELNISFF